MRNHKRQYIYFCLPMAIFFICLLSSFNHKSNDKSNANTYHIDYSCVKVPTSIEFCGKTIDLSRYDRRERMDRELLAFSYMHSTSIQMLKRANRYLPVIEPILKANNIPDDFKYLMLIESGANPRARSGTGAAGLWQFMPATAQSYGLEVNRFIDERYDIEKSTVAACKYLHEAYEIFGNWESVAASYNAGKARISQFMNKQQQSTSLDLYMAEETSRYVYRIFVAKIFVNNPSLFGFNLRSEDLYPQIPYTVVKTNQTITDLAEFAKEQGITYAILKDMNPWLRDTSMPCTGKKTYSIKIPTKEGIYYKPSQTKVHNKNCVIE